MSRKTTNARPAAVRKVETLPKPSPGARAASGIAQETPSLKSRSKPVDYKPKQTASLAENSRDPTRKIDTVINMLRAKGGASVAQISKATDWQAHSIRGAISGQIKKKLGQIVLSEKIAGTRFYL